MIIVESYPLAVIMCFVTMICWGSWANTQKLVGREWPFRLFYWDYALGVFIFSIGLAFTMGNFGSAGRSFLDDLAQASSPSIVSALLGGVIFNIANLLLVAAIDMAGLSVAFPIAIGFSCSLGVILNYFASPVGNPVFLFSGVAALLGAVVVDAIAYKRLQTQARKTSSRGIVISIISGILMGFFFRFVTAALGPNFRDPEAGKLTPYTAVFIFSVGLLLSNFVWNSNLLAGLSLWSRVRGSDYFTKGTPRLHLIGILGGVIWNLGMGFSIIASGVAGYAISFGLGQGGTMVAALWGVFVWKEFKGAPAGTIRYIAVMFALYVAALGLIIISRF